MVSVNFLNIGIVVAFVASLTYALYKYFSENVDIQKWWDKFTNNRDMHASTPVQSDVAYKLQRAGINVHPAAFHLLCFITAGITMYLVSMYTLNIVAGLVFAILGYRMPYWILDAINSVYDKKMSAQLQILISTTPQTILASGSMIKTLENIVRIIDDPLRSELTKILGAKRLGKSLETSFAELGQRTGHPELITYAKITTIAETKGVQSAADSFKRLDRVLEQQRKLDSERKSQIAEYSMFIRALIFGLPALYVAVCSMSDVANEALRTWGMGKVATVIIAIAIVASYFGYKMGTKDVNMTN